MASAGDIIELVEVERRREDMVVAIRERRRRILLGRDEPESLHREGEVEDREVELEEEGVGRSGIIVVVIKQFD